MRQAGRWDRVVAEASMSSPPANSSGLMEATIRLCYWRAVQRYSECGSKPSTGMAVQHRNADARVTLQHGARVGVAIRSVVVDMIQSSGGSEARASDRVYRQDGTINSVALGS